MSSLLKSSNNFLLPPPQVDIDSEDLSDEPKRIKSQQHEDLGSLLLESTEAYLD